MGCCLSCPKRFCCTRYQIYRYFATCYVPDVEYRGVCAWPHGCCYSFMSIMSGFGGMYMNMYVLMSCFMQRIKMVNPVTGDTIPGSERGYGFFAKETDYGLESDYQQCSYYTQAEIDTYFDPWVRSGKMFAMISQFLGTTAFLILFNTCWCAFSQELFSRWLVWFYLLGACSMAMSYLIFGNEICQENRCKVAAGSGYALTTFMFYLSTCNTVKSIGAAHPKQPNKKRNIPNPFRRKMNNPASSPDGDDEEDEEDQHLADLYYENDAEKYPLPECTPEGRERYAAIAAYADDTDQRQLAKDESESEEESEYESEEYTDDEGGDEDDDDDDDDDDNDDEERIGKRKKKSKDDQNGDRASGMKEQGSYPGAASINTNNAVYDDGYYESPNVGQEQDGYEMVSYNNGGAGPDDYPQDTYAQTQEGQYAPTGEYDQGYYQSDPYDSGYNQGVPDDQGYNQGDPYDPYNQGYDPTQYQPGGFDPRHNDPSYGFDPSGDQVQQFEVVDGNLGVGYDQPYDPSGVYDPTYDPMSGGEPSEYAGPPSEFDPYADDNMGTGYEGQRRPQVGDPDGPTIT